MTFCPEQPGRRDGKREILRELVRRECDWLPIRNTNDPNQAPVSASWFSAGLQTSKRLGATNGQFAARSDHVLIFVLDLAAARLVPNGPMNGSQRCAYLVWRHPAPCWPQ